MNEFISAISESHRPRPWPRYFAKCLDLSLTAYFPARYLILGYVRGLPSDQIINPFDPVVSFMVLLTWIFVDSIFLTTFGTSPGRWLFGLYVVDTNGNKLSFGSAISRSIMLSIQGLCVGLPLFPLITMYFAYKRLKSTGSTLWDISSKSMVIHKPSTFFRSLTFSKSLVIGILIALFLGWLVLTRSS